MRRLIIATLFAVLPVSVSAQAFKAENHLIVVPLGSSTFEVIEALGEGPRGIWCAAADFAQQQLGVAPASRIYIKQGRGPSISGAGRTGIVFTTDETQLDVPTRQSISLSVRQKGLGLPVHHAVQFCSDYIIDRFDSL